MRERREYLLMAVAFAMVAAAIGIGFVAVSRVSSTAPSGTPEPAALATERTEEPEPLGVLVVGDSYVGGSLMNSGPTWPHRLAQDMGWALIADGVGGSGYLNSGQGVSYPMRFTETVSLWRYQEDPDLVFLTGGNNDRGRYPDSELQSAIGSEISKVRREWPQAEIVLFGPWSYGDPDSDYPAFAQLFAEVAAEEAVAFLDVSSFVSDEDIGTDGVHPTDDGHARIAARVARGLDRLGTDAR